MNTIIPASHGSRCVLMLIALLCAASSNARAQQDEPAAAPADAGAPSTQFTERPEDAAVREERMRRSMWQGQRGPSGERTEGWQRTPIDMEEDPSPEEWEDVAQFTRRHSPKRWKMFMELPEDKRDRVRRFMYWRYRQVKHLEEVDAEMYALHVKRLAIEDEIFPLAWLIRRADGDETKEVADAREALRKHVVALVDIGLKERAVRLERMKRRLNTEQEQLSLDQARQAELVDQRMEEIFRSRGGPWIGGGGDGPRRPFVGGPEGRAGEPIGAPRPPEGR